MDDSWAGFSVHEMLQARILEWVVMPFSRGSPNPGIEPGYPALQTDSLPTEPGKLYIHTHTYIHIYIFFILFSIMVYHRILYF